MEQPLPEFNLFFQHQGERNFLTGISTHFISATVSKDLLSLSLFFYLYSGDEGSKHFSVFIFMPDFLLAFSRLLIFVYSIFFWQRVIISIHQSLTCPNQFHFILVTLLSDGTF
jgi:hypothetical protein